MVGTQCTVYGNEALPENTMGLSLVKDCYALGFAIVPSSSSSSSSSPGPEQRAITAILGEGPSFQTLSDCHESRFTHFVLFDAQ